MVEKPCRLLKANLTNTVWLQIITVTMTPDSRVSNVVLSTWVKQRDENIICLKWLQVLMWSLIWVSKYDDSMFMPLLIAFGILLPNQVLIFFYYQNNYLALIIIVQFLPFENTNNECPFVLSFHACLHMLNMNYCIGRNYKIYRYSKINFLMCPNSYLLQYIVNTNGRTIGVKDKDVSLN